VRALLEARDPRSLAAEIRRTLDEVHAVEALSKQAQDR
jgi:hypothetical protein